MAIEKRIAVYIGRRLTTDHKLAYFWKFEGEDKTKGYKENLFPAVIGEAWEFSFDKGLVYLRGDKAPIRARSDKDADPKDVTQWAAEDTAANQMYQEEKARKKLEKRKQPFDQAMEPLLRMYESLPTNTERAAFIQAVQKAFLYRR